MKTITVPADEFEALARGDGNTTGVLQGGLYSKRLLVLHALRMTAEAPDLAAFALLGEAQKRAPTSVAEVLLDPHVGAWVTACLHAAAGGEDNAADHHAHLGSIVAAAAWRAGLAFDVQSRLVDGGVVLPTLGKACLDAPDGPCRIRSAEAVEAIEVVADGRSVVVSTRQPGSEAAAWLPLRRICCEAGGLTLDVAVDDVGPYRDCGELAVADRLDTRVFDGWHESLDQGWAILVRDHREQAEAIATGVVALVPLRATDATEELSATCHAAAGSIAMTTPRRPLSAALALVHEFQHTKLTALLDVVPFLDPAPDKSLHAPWRPDPRPLGGLLQGTYAFLGLTRFWDARRRAPEPPEPWASPDWAEFELALGRLQLAEALATLGKADELRPLGRRFVTGMSDELARLDGHSVSPRVQALAWFAARDHFVSWRLRNMRPDPQQVARVAAAWIDERPCPWPTELRTAVVDGGGPVASAGRLAFLRKRLAFPKRPLGSRAGLTLADLSLLDGGPAVAQGAYGERLAHSHDDIAAWSGFIAAGDWSSGPEGPTELHPFPEWVVAVHRVVRERHGRQPDPGKLAAWIAGA